jgi:hypothetical protein
LHASALRQHSQYACLSSEHKDIVSYLEKELEIKDQQIDQLNDQMDILRSKNKDLISSNGMMKLELEKFYNNRGLEHGGQILEMSELTSY